MASSFPCVRATPLEDIAKVGIAGQQVYTPPSAVKVDVVAQRRGRQELAGRDIIGTNPRHRSRGRYADNVAEDAGQSLLQGLLGGAVVVDVEQERGVEVVDIQGLVMEAVPVLAAVAVMGLTPGTQ